MPADPGHLRAWRVRTLGTPAEALSLEHLTARAPRAGEARVAVHAIGLNFPDLLVCAGRYQERPPLPFSPGFEAAGVVVEAGADSCWRAGQPVIVVPELPEGALQESLTAADAQLYAVPQVMPMTDAAVLHIAYATAHMALHHRGGLRPGETVLVHGASGGVGSAAVQLAHAAGARVIATATGPEKTQACERLGADLVIDTAADDVLEQVHDATGGGGANVVVDVVGGPLFDLSRHCIAVEGRLVVVGFTSGTIGAAPANHVLLRNYSVVGLNLATYRRQDPSLLRAVHDDLLALYASGAIRPRIDHDVPFDRAPEGLDLLSERRAVGRVVLTC